MTVLFRRPYAAIQRFDLKVAVVNCSCFSAVTPAVTSSSRDKSFQFYLKPAIYLKKNHLLQDTR